MIALSERAATRRLLDRFGFGPRPGETSRGFHLTLTGLLSPGGTHVDAGTRATPPPTIDAPPMVSAKRIGDASLVKAVNTRLQRQQQTLTSWWLDRMVATDAPAVERLTWFWHGHFATSEQKVRSPRLMLRQNETFRRLGMGSFTDLAKAMIVDPAMLIWLDAQQNKAGSPNENLAREFMELFCLGVHQYTETDVRQAARALTGWTVRRDSISATFMADRHDNASKTFLGSTGDFDAHSFVDIVLSKPESARFVVGRLWARLVSATPPTADVLDRLVAAYGQRRDIRALLSAIASEPAFRQDSATSLVKQPVEWAVGLMRACAIRPATLGAAHITALCNGLRKMGQLPFEPPSVGGWSSGPAWLTTSAGAARLQVASLIAANADVGTISAASRRARPDAARELLGVDAWSARTSSALSTVADWPEKLLTIAACAPEYVVSY
ncbi:MAG: DUF1800 domain-containing protein [Sciscionella sp.]|nr:DUF1800 domain-containing protein [Sciscionella sp.]